MSIKNSQAILKHFIDLKSSIWFTLGSEEETMFCDTNYFSSTAGQGFQNTNWQQGPIYGPCCYCA